MSLLGLGRLYVGIVKFPNIVNTPIEWNVYADSVKEAEEKINKELAETFKDEPRELLHICKVVEDKEEE